MQTFIGPNGQVFSEVRSVRGRTTSLYLREHLDRAVTAYCRQMNLKKSVFISSLTQRFFDDGAPETHEQLMEALPQLRS